MNIKQLKIKNIDVYSMALIIHYKPEIVVSILPNHDDTFK